MNFPSFEKKTRVYDWPPFATDYHALPDRQIKEIKNVGFDFVRLMVAPGIYLQVDAEKKKYLNERLRGQIKRLLDVGLKVVVEVHPIDTNPDYAMAKFVVGLDDPMFKDYLLLIEDLARIIAEFPEESVAFETMNEPAVDFGTVLFKRWPKLQAALFKAARKAAPEVTIVVTGGAGGLMQGLFDLDLEPYDDNVLYSFHYYEPMTFTHQNNPKPDDPRVYNIFALPFPATDLRREMVYARVEREMHLDGSIPENKRDAKLTAARKSLDKYFAEGWNEAKVMADIEKVGAWADKNKISRSGIFLGEFGARRSYKKYIGAETEDWRRYMAAVRAGAERSGFIWAAFSHHNWGFGLTDDGPEFIFQPAAIRALGLDEKRGCG